MSCLRELPSTQLPGLLRKTDEITLLINLIFVSTIKCSVPKKTNAENPALSRPRRTRLPATDRQYGIRHPWQPPLHSRSTFWKTLPTPWYSCWSQRITRFPSWSSLRRKRTPLAAANGNKIICKTHPLSLNIGSQESNWIIIAIADVNRPIFGTDFLRANSLLVDLQGRLIHSGTYASVSLSKSQHAAPHITVVSS